MSLILIVSIKSVTSGPWLYVDTILLFEAIGNERAADSIIPLVVKEMIQL